RERPRGAAAMRAAARWRYAPTYRRERRTLGNLGSRAVPDELLRLVGALCSGARAVHSSPSVESRGLVGRRHSSPPFLKRGARHAPYPAPLISSNEATGINPGTDCGLRSVERLGDLRNGQVVAVLKPRVQRLQLRVEPIARYND